MTLELALLLLADVDTPHARQRIERPAPNAVAPRELDAPNEVRAFKAWVYGYYPDWVGPLENLPWDRLTHVAVFDVGITSDGTITNTDFWNGVATQAVEMGSAYGVKIHLTVVNFDPTSTGAMLSNPSARTNAVTGLTALVDAHGAHGVSVDFEGMNAANSADLVAFVEELAASVEEVTIATPAVDWNGAYDYDLLAAASDGLFIMAYDYHWRGGDPGPVAPLVGGAPWGQYAIGWTVDDYLVWGATADKMILGLPLYGYSWPSTGTNIPGTATADASSVLFAEAVVAAQTYGRQWDAVSSTPYYFPSGSEQTFYDDTESLDAKIGFAMEAGLRGIGFWALNYEEGDPAFWDMVAEHTQVDEPDPTSTTGAGSESGDTAADGSSSSGEEPEPTSVGSTDSQGSGAETNGGSGGGSAALPAPQDSEDGCSCRGGGGAQAWMLAMLLALLRRGRSRAR